jgi:predicted RND superfamily exporter protein
MKTLKEEMAEIKLVEEAKRSFYLYLEDYKKQIKLDKDYKEAKDKLKTILPNAIHDAVVNNKSGIIILVKDFSATNFPSDENEIKGIKNIVLRNVDKSMYDILESENFKPELICTRRWVGGNTIYSSYHYECYIKIQLKNI